jgi:hypothetical protein
MKFIKIPSTDSAQGIKIAPGVDATTTVAGATLATYAISPSPLASKDKELLSFASADVVAPKTIAT